MKNPEINCDFNGNLDGNQEVSFYLENKNVKENCVK